MAGATKLHPPEISTVMTTTLRLLVVAALAHAASGTSLSALRGGALFGSKERELDTDAAKAWYALGCNCGRQLGDLACLSEADLDYVLEGARDVLLRKEPRVSLQDHLPKAAELFKEAHEAERTKAMDAGKVALESAAAEDGASTLESGLVMRSIEDGAGDPPTENDIVQVHLVWTLPDGTVVDDSTKRGVPITLPLSAAPVKALKEGLMRMRPGGKAHIVAPASLGFGDQGRSTVPPGAALIFEVELLQVTPKGDAGAGDSDDDEDDDN